uniref:Uncharacterized protein n=1 Tax=Cucumis melo TaxID=3656 RepID=A0A9I9DW37_CUCME
MEMMMVLIDRIEDEDDNSIYYNNIEDEDGDDDRLNRRLQDGDDDRLGCTTLKMEMMIVLAVLH